MTQALHSVQAVCFADFVAFLDADEFIRCPDAATLREKLEPVPVGEAALLPWQTYLPSPEAEQSGEPLAQVTHRRRAEAPQYYKAIIRLGGLIDRSLTVGQGSHFLKRSRKTVTGHKIEDVPLMHIPLRSLNQLTAKGVIGWEAQLKKTKKRKGQAYQWERIHTLASDPDTLATKGLLAQEALIYAQADHDAVFETHAVKASHGLSLERRYSDGQFGLPSELIAASRDTKHEAGFQLADQGQSKVGERTDVANAFDNAWHWDNLFLDAPAFRYLFEKYRPETVLDVGCGVGGYLNYLKTLGVQDVFGVDGIPSDATVLEPSAYQKVDLQVPLDLGRTFDLVMCIEVIEHLEPGTTDIAFESIARHARDLIVFSMGEPGQPGNGHINCLGLEDVLARWAKLGWYPVLTDSLGARALSTLSWLRRNIVVLQRSGDAPDHGKARGLLCDIAQMRYHWYSQPSGLRLAPFKETRTKKNIGYPERSL